MSAYDDVRDEFIDDKRAREQKHRLREGERADIEDQLETLDRETTQDDAANDTSLRAAINGCPFDTDDPLTLRDWLDTRL